MKKIFLWFALVLPTIVFGTPDTARPGAAVPTAVLYPFELRNSATQADGRIIAELLGVELTRLGAVRQVNRTDLTLLLGEKRLAAAGVTATDDPEGLAKLAGAKLFIGGSCFQIGDKYYLVAKVTGTATGEVVGGSVSGTGDWPELIPPLAEKIRELLAANAAVLLPEPPDVNQVIVQLAGTVDGADRTVWVDIPESILTEAPDPAAETELKRILLALRFTVADSGTGADYRIVGEAVAAPAGTFRDDTAAAARIELAVYDQRTDRLLAIGSAVETLSGSSYVIVAKSAIAAATRQAAAQLLPVLAREQPER